MKHEKKTHNAKKTKTCACNKILNNKNPCTVFDRLNTGDEINTWDI